MKTVAILACLVASVSAFSPLMATRAVGKAPAKAAVKKAVKKVVAAAPAPKKSRKGPPPSQGYPSFESQAAQIKFSFSGGGNKAPKPTFPVYPFLGDEKMQKQRDPALYAAAAKTRLAKKKEFVYDDGLTELERKQRSSKLTSFLTGSAKSQADLSTIRKDIEEQEYPFGLDADRFQLLFIAVFGLLTLVGCLSGAIKL